MEHLKSAKETLPYTCLTLDTEFNHFVSACWKALTVPSSASAHLHSLLKQLFIESNGPGCYLPCFSVRTAFHSFLKVANFPPGSEIIMSAINIPDMIKIVEFHGLKVVPVDISADTLAPKTEIMELLVNEKTVAILVAHLFGKWHDVEPALEIAKKNHLYFLEDAAQAFTNCQNFGHADSDLVFLSFGVIKNSTSFGGAVVKVKDEIMFHKMTDILGELPVQRNKQYFLKALKYCLVHMLLKPFSVRVGRPLLEVMGYDPKEIIIKMIRTFPENLLDSITKQPCVALLSMMLKRLNEAKSRINELNKIKGDFVSKHLPEEVFVVGKKAKHVDYWMYPVLVKNPEELIQCLNKLGVDAYRGVSQLNVIEPSKENFITRKPSSYQNTQHLYNDFSQILRNDTFSDVHSKNTSFEQSDFPLVTPSPQKMESCSPPNPTLTHYPEQKLLWFKYRSPNMTLQQPTFCQLSSKTNEEDSSCLNMPKSDNHVQTWNLMRLNLYPREAHFIMDHLVYLPVHKKVPFSKLLTICQAVKVAVAATTHHKCSNGLGIKAHL